MDDKDLKEWGENETRNANSRDPAMSPKALKKSHPLGSVHTFMKHALEPDSDGQRYIVTGHGHGTINARHETTGVERTYHPSRLIPLG